MDDPSAADDDPLAEEAPDPALAAALGFSAFGAAPAKKRKYNHHDAFVDPSATSSAQPPAFEAKGANTTQLGVRRRHDTALAQEPAPPGAAAPTMRPTASPPPLGMEKAADLTLGGPPLVLTPEELRVLARGVRTADGDLVVFLPSFVEDPWARGGG